METTVLWVAVLLLISVLSSKLSDRFALPALLLFLGIGILAGSEGLGGIHFDDYRAAKSLGIIALVFIIYDGGLDTSWKSVKPLFTPGLVLSTVGVLITAVIVGVFAMVLLDFSLLEGLLLGSIVSSTDAAAVFSILRSKKISLKGNLRPLLELESGSNDPMAIFLTLSCIGFLTVSDFQPLMLLPAFLLNMGVGILIGYFMAKAGILLLNKIKLEYEGLYQVLIIALILLTYAATTLLAGNGFLAVYVVGLIMSRDEFVYKRSIIRFYKATAWLMQIAMFVTLGLLVFPSQIALVAASGLLTAFVLIFVARPISVFLCLAPFKFPIADKTMIAWVGLRGAVPIVLAIFPLLAGISQAQMIFNMVFFIVITSILIQGASIPFVSKILKVKTPHTTKIKYPIEFEQLEGIEASLIDLIVPYNSDVVGKTIAAMNVPPKALVVLIAREEKFIVPNGSTIIEDGDVLLVLASGEDLKAIQKTLTTLHK